MTYSSIPERRKHLHNKVKQTISTLNCTLLLLLLLPAPNPETEQNPLNCNRNPISNEVHWCSFQNDFCLPPSLLPMGREGWGKVLPQDPFLRRETQIDCSRRERQFYGGCNFQEWYTSAAPPSHFSSHLFSGKKAFLLHIKRNPIGERKIFRFHLPFPHPLPWTKRYLSRAIAVFDGKCSFSQPISFE